MSTIFVGTTRTLSSMGSQTFRTENSKSSLLAFKNTFKLNGGHILCSATRSSFYPPQLTLLPSHLQSLGSIILSICTRQFETLFWMYQMKSFSWSIRNTCFAVTTSTSSSDLLRLSFRFAINSSVDWPVKSAPKRIMRSPSECKGILRLRTWARTWCFIFCATSPFSPMCFRDFEEIGSTSTS